MGKAPSGEDQAGITRLLKITATKQTRAAVLPLLSPTQRSIDPTRTTCLLTTKNKGDLMLGPLCSSSEGTGT